MPEYKPGDVAYATVRGVPDVLVVRRETRWSTAKPIGPDGDYIHHEHDVTDIRPAVVLDLSKAPMSRFPETMLGALRREGTFTGAWLAGQIEAQIKPPKPPEPTGLGAVVEDAEGRKFVRTGTGDFPWTNADRAYRANVYHWTEEGGLDGSYAVRVLSEGVTDAT